MAQNVNTKQDMLAHSYNPSTWDVEEEPGVKSSLAM